MANATIPAGILEGSGINTFLELLDVPSSYAGQAAQVLKVKGTEDGVEFGGDSVGVSGSGTIGALPKFTAATVLGDSLLSDDGSNVTLASGQLLIPDGSAETPALAFSSDIDSGINLSGGLIRFGVGGAESLHVSGTDIVAAASGGIDMSVNPIRFSEVATVPGGVPAAGTGKLWVKNDVPNVLMFTDDAGTDWNVLDTGVDTWLALTDTPGSFTANTLYKANAGATALVASNITDNGSAVTIGGSQLLIPDGSAEGPGLSFSSDTDTGINLSGGLVRIGVGGAESLHVGATDIVAVGSGGLDMSVNPMRFSEAAAVPGGVPAAGTAKLWVKNDVPNVLMFTDDAGTDWNVLDTGVDTWVGLTDTPGSFTANTVYKANAGATALEASNLTDDGTTVTFAGSNMRGPAGSAAAPAYSFTGATDQGMYDGGLGTLSFAVGGAAILNLDATQVSANQRFTGPAGAVGAPTYSFQTDGDSGMYSGGADNVSIATGGTLAVQVDSSDAQFSRNVSLSSASFRYTAPESATGTPKYTFGANDGIGLTGDILHFTVDSSDHMRLVKEPTTGTLTIKANEGIYTVGEPHYSFIGDDDSGISRSAADTLVLVTGGTVGLTLNASQQVLINTGEPAPGEVILGFVGDTDTGIKQTAGANTLTIACGGQDVLQGNATGQALFTGFVADTASIAASSDTDTGINWRAADSLQVLAGGVEVARFAESGAAAQIGFFGATPVGQSAAYTRNATVVEDRTLLASASATATNNNNVLAALIADLQAIGILG